MHEGAAREEIMTGKDLKTRMLETCRLLWPLWERIGRRDRGLAEQGRRAMQSMVLQFAEGEHAHRGNRTAKLLGARSEAHEARMCLELAGACGLVRDREVAMGADRLDHHAAALWLKVHRPR